MIIKLQATTYVIVVALFWAVMPLHAENYALATSPGIAGNNGKLLILSQNTTWGGQKYRTLYEFSSGVKPTGVAVYGTYAFVADASSGGSIRVLKINNMAGLPTAELIKTIPLSMGTSSDPSGSPGSVSVDSQGNVFVVSETGTKAKYAYLPAPAGMDWANYNTANTITAATSSTVDYSPIVDIATYKSGGVDKAITVHQSTEVSALSYVSTIIGPIGTQLTTEIGPTSYNPSAICVDSSTGTALAYVANRPLDESGIINVIPADSHSNPAVYALPSFRPHDLCTFSVGGNSFLGIVGITTGGIHQAWKVPLDSYGMPIFESSSIFEISIATLHKAASSSDGSTFWIVSPESKTFTVLNTTSWSGISVNTAQQISRVAAFSYVPEPSSIAALATMLMGSLGIALRRKR